MQQLAGATKSALEKMGFTQLTGIQEKSIAAIAAGKDVVARSPTGTGKTAAFLIPIIEKIVTVEKTPRLDFSKIVQSKALVLEPSRELVIQAANECRKLSEGTHLRCVAAYGGTPPQRQEELIKAGAQIVIGTPGRVAELLQKGIIKPSEYAFFVLDEADRLLSGQFERQVVHIASRMPKNRQTLMFGVQLTSEKMKTALPLLKKEFEEIKVGKVSGETITHSYLLTSNKQKTLAEMLKKRKGKALVFCTTVESADSLKRELAFHGVRSKVFHAQVRSSERQQTIKKFKGEIEAKNEGYGGETLIATDVAARGMHFPGVNRVISFELPAQPDFYLHRAGRTGRMRQSGECISLINEKELPALKRIYSFCGVEAKQAKT